MFLDWFCFAYLKEKILKWNFCASFVIMGCWIFKILINLRLSEIFSNSFFIFIFNDWALFPIVSILVWITNIPDALMLQVGDIEGDAPSAKRLRMSPADALQDMISGEELSLYGSAQNNAESAQVVHFSKNAFPVCVFSLLNLFHTRNLEWKDSERISAIAEREIVTGWAFKFELNTYVFLCPFYYIFSN